MRHRIRQDYKGAKVNLYTDINGEGLTLDPSEHTPPLKTFELDVRVDDLGKFVESALIPDDALASALGEERWDCLNCNAGLQKAAHFEYEHAIDCEQALLKPLHLREFSKV